MGEIKEARLNFHRKLLENSVVGLRDNVPTMADVSSEGSRAIAVHLTHALSASTGVAAKSSSLSGQTLGRLFSQYTAEFINSCLHLLPQPSVGTWEISQERPIDHFDQYGHLSEIKALVDKYEELQLDFGEDYVITPVIVVAKRGAHDRAFGAAVLEDGDGVASVTPIRRSNTERPILHASISCKWTIRSDRAQNTRTEALNLVRNRKGRLPTVAAVTIEPMPTRLASLAKGTGDIDRVYHVALYELREAVVETGNEQQRRELDLLVRGKRLADISDLPFDLLI
jgi:hypothetical protein